MCQEIEEKVPRHKLPQDSRIGKDTADPMMDAGLANIEYDTDLTVQEEI